MSQLFERLIPENGYVIGETACGHEGDINKLEELIDCVSDSQAQIIKFQIFLPIERATKDHPEWQIFNDLALTKNEWARAVQYAREKDLIILADIFGVASINLTYKEGLCPVAESIQPKLIQLKTNFESIKTAEEQALILSETIDEISGS